jgi:hypothetical protein
VQNWWEQDEVVGASQAGAPRLVPLGQKAPKEPTPQTPEQARGQALTNIRTQQQIDEHNESQSRNGLNAKDYNDLLARETMLGDFIRSIDDLERQYRVFYQGDRGGVLGMGGQTNVGGYLPSLFRPENQTFNDKADSLVGTVAGIQGATGGEMNSLAEMRARFGPLLPNSTDNDATIEQKLGDLRAMVESQRRSLEAQLGRGVAMPAPARDDASPAVTPSSMGMDATQQQVMAPGSGGPQLAVNDGEATQTVADPALAGLNRQINEMMKGGASARDFMGLLQQNGISPSEVMPSIMQAIRWRERNPSYRGDYDVNVETMVKTMNPVRRAIADAAFSPVGAGAVAAGNVVTGNRLDNLVEATGGDGETANLGMAALRDANPGSSLAGDVLGGLSLYGAGRGALAAAGRAGAPATGTFALPAVGGDAAMGFYIGSGSDGTDPLSLGGGVMGAGAAMAGGAIGRGAINSAARAVSPTGGALREVYKEGGRPTIGQRIGGVADRAEQAFASIPGIGGVQRSARNAAVQDWQAGAFNKALREIGEKLPKGVKSGTSAHAYMQRAFDKAYDKARSGMTFRPDQDFANDLGRIQQDVAALSDQSKNAFRNIIKGNLGNRLAARGGTLGGDDYKRAVSQITKKANKLRNNPQGDHELAAALEDFAAAMDGAARRHSPPEFAKLLDNADRGYAQAALIEGAGKRAGGGEIGEFTGKQLEAEIRNNSGVRSRRMLSGNALLQDYAAAGVRLGDSVPDSGTPERLMTMGGLAGMAHFLDPLTLTPWAIDTAANLPGVRQGVNALIAPNRPALDPVREAMMRRARLGGAVGAPLALPQD